MTIQWAPRGRARIAALAAALIALLPHLFFPLALPADYPVGYALLLGALLGAFAWLVFMLRFEARAWWGAALELFFASGVAAAVVHMPMFEYSYASAMAYLNTACLFMAPGFVIFALSGNIKIYSAALLTACWLYGIMNYEVFCFTGNIISYSQILAVRTGINVMRSYRFVMGPYVLSATLLCVLGLIALKRFRETGLKRLRVRAAALALAAAVAVLPVHGLMTRRVRSWKSGALYGGNGLPLELLLEMKNARIRPPEGYSEATLSNLAAYADAPQSATEVRPHVIALMLETFSDLTVLGDFSTNIDPLACTHALASESRHGFYMASTLAGGTSRTEWEFLTGNTMFFLPADSTPYMQYVQGEANSLVKVFKNAGYHTIGMHCHDGNGWNRSRVYPLMGFDDVYFGDDLDWGEAVRGYTSDHAFVQTVIRQFEARSADAPLFLFGVSLQNHGGYTDPSFPADVRAEGLSRDYGDVNQYLSLMKLSDEAVGELVDYFRGVDEPVLILVFGDHQPGLDAQFYRELGVSRRGSKYIVPWLLWKNWDDTPSDEAMTSANYLTALVAREAGVEMPAYYRFLEALKARVPLICSLGYESGGKYYDREDAPDAETGARIAEYEGYQYANLFDPGADPALFQGAP